MIESGAARGDLSRNALPDEALFEERLRPRTLAEMIGQDRLRENLAVFIRAARARGETLDHVLFHGPPGLGKTSLAGAVANELGAPLRTTSGPAIERPGDLAALLSNLEAGNVWNNRGDVSLTGLYTAGSAFVAADTWLGPFYFAYGRASGDHSSFYIFLGRL